MGKQEIVKLPSFMLPRKNCLGDVLPPFVSIDTGMVEEIKELWSKGIYTTGCCSGHPDNPYIGVTNECIAAMEAMGYEHVCNPHEVFQSTFYPKKIKKYE